MASDNVTNYCDNFNNDDPAEGIVTRAPSGPDDFVFSAAVMGGGAIIFFTQLLRQMQSLIIIVAKTKQCISTCATDIVPLPFITRLFLLLAYMSPYSDYGFLTATGISGDCCYGELQRPPVSIGSPPSW